MTQHQATFNKILFTKRGFSDKKCTEIVFDRGYAWTPLEKTSSLFPVPLIAFGVSVPGRVFTARCYASAVLAMALCPSVRLSVRHKSVFYSNG